MKNVLSKLALARVAIRATKLEKKGFNAYSNYKYFTPEQIGKLVDDSCKENNLIVLHNLKQDEKGFFSELIIIDMDNEEQILFITRTAVPTIKATNETQQYGGMLTYSKRYALMNAFDIEDNTIDFDSQDNSKKQITQQRQTNKKQWLTDEKQWLTDANCDIICQRIIKGEKEIYQKTIDFYKISKSNKEKLETALKN